MSASHIPSPGEIVDGKYRIEHELGRGGMAVVLAATQLLARREVAIKWLLPAVARSEHVVARFLGEAQAAARIQHPNVVQILDVGRTGDGFYLVMERVTGETVRARMQRLGPPPVAEVVSIACGVLGALHAAHRAGVVHRDVKPENVLVRLDERGRPRGVKVLDFGISKLSESESLTLTGQYFGTAHYLAPEQAAGTGDRSSPRIDVYQTGVLLYEMLTGRHPYESDTYAGILVAIMTTEHAPIGMLRADLPPSLAHAIDRAMTRDPSARPADALALAKLFANVPGARFDEELERALVEEAGTAPAMLALSEADVRGVAPPPTSAPSVVAPAARPSPLPPLPTSGAGWGAIVLGIGALGLAAALTTFGVWRFTRGAPPAPVAPVALGAPPPTASIADLDAQSAAVDAGGPLPPPVTETPTTPTPTTPTTPSRHEDDDAPAAPSPETPPSTSAPHHPGHGSHAHMSTDEF